jgi:hypothetical protein
MLKNEEARAPGAEAMEAMMLVRRMCTDAAGDSRFDPYQVPLELHDHVPPAAPFFTAHPTEATSYILFRQPSGWVGNTTPSDTELSIGCLFVREVAVH